MSFLSKGLFWLSHHNPMPIAMPAALLVDICAIPILGCADVITIGWDYAIAPIAKHMPDKVLEASLKGLLFIVPLAIIGGICWVAYKAFTGGSAVPAAQDNKSLLTRIYETCSGFPSNHPYITGVIMFIAGAALGNSK